MEHHLFYKTNIHTLRAMNEFFAKMLPKVQLWCPRCLLMPIASWIWWSENPPGSIIVPFESKNDKTFVPNSRNLMAANSPDREIYAIFPRSCGIT